MDWSVLAGDAYMNGTSVPAWLLLGWIVLVATVAAYLTGVVAIRRLSPQVAGVVACLEAVIATVLAWVLLGEHLSVAQTRRRRGRAGGRVHRAELDAEGRAGRSRRGRGSGGRERRCRAGGRPAYDADDRLHSRTDDGQRSVR